MQKGGDPEPAQVPVFDDGEPVEVARLPILELADGRPGALWRGQVFPLRPDGSIDIAGPFVTVEDCLPRRAAPGGWSLLGEGGEAVLLLAGGVVERDRALAALRAADIGTLGVVPALDPDLEADWVVRLEPASIGPEAEARLREVLDGILGGPPPAAEALRGRLLELQLDRLRAENERLREELEQARAAAASTIEARPAAILPAASESSSLQLEPVSIGGGTVPAAPVPTAAAGRERLVRRLGEEVAALLSAFPRIELLGDSRLTLLTCYRDRRAVYRVLGELDRGEPLQRRFKPVRGCEAWQECHVSTGQDDSGRIYVRRGPEDRWQVLVSLKEAQRRDVERLNAFPPRPG